jgi:hypothetical protein
VGLIPEALVKETWLEIGALSETQARGHMDQIARSQPHLLAFVLESTEGSRTDAQQVGVYLFVVIYRMFEKTAGLLQRAKPQAIEAAYKRNEAFLEKLQGARARFLENAATSMISSQPFVMKYLVEALMEAPEGDDPVVLSDEETRLLFLILKTVVDILDEVELEPGVASPSSPDL